MSLNLDFIYNHTVHTGTMEQDRDGSLKFKVNCQNWKGVTLEVEGSVEAAEIANATFSDSSNRKGYSELKQNGIGMGYSVAQRGLEALQIFDHRSGEEVTVNISGTEEYRKDASRANSVAANIAATISDVIEYAYRHLRCLREAGYCILKGHSTVQIHISGPWRDRRCIVICYVN